MQGGNVGWNNSNISAIDDGGVAPASLNNAIGCVGDFLPNSSTSSISSTYGPYLFGRVLYQKANNTTGDIEYVAVKDNTLYLVKALNWRKFGLNSMPNMHADTSGDVNMLTTSPSLTTQTVLIADIPVDYSQASKSGLNGYNNIYYHNGNIVHINASSGAEDYGVSVAVKVNRYNTSGALNDSIEIDFTSSAEKPAAYNSNSNAAINSSMRVFIPGVSNTNHDKALYIAPRCTANNTTWTADNLVYGVWALSADGHDTVNDTWAATYLGDLQYADGTSISAYDGNYKAPSYIPQLNAFSWSLNDGAISIFIAVGDTPTAETVSAVPRAVVLPTCKGTSSATPHYHGTPTEYAIVNQENSALPYILTTQVRFGTANYRTNNANSVTGIRKFNNCLGSINNLDSEVEKTTAYTMKITYDITEVV